MEFDYPKEYERFRDAARDAVVALRKARTATLAFDDNYARLDQIILEFEKLAERQCAAFEKHIGKA
jgi:hypothetical protein